MLDQKSFGIKLRNHRKRLGMTQEEVAERIGISAQAISKWEAGDCLPDCFNLKAIGDIYHISLDALLETETDGDIDSVADKIEQLGMEFIWADKNKERYNGNLRQELGADLWKMWKGLYFAEVGNPVLQVESKQRGNLRISGGYGMKIWDDEGIACIVQSSLVKGSTVATHASAEVICQLCSPEGQNLIKVLDCQETMPKESIVNATGMELHRLNELLLLFTENKIIEFVADKRMAREAGYKLSGHCGSVAYMTMAAMHILEKKNYTVSEFYPCDR